MFFQSLQEYHPISSEKFREEVMALGDLFADADHFHFFFTDRDGTLKSYSCFYSASIQPAYSGVIQVRFQVRLTMSLLIRLNLLIDALKHVLLLPQVCVKSLVLILSFFSKINFKFF